MKIKVLGGHGGEAPGFATTSFLIDDKLLLDAGAVASALTVNKQAEVDFILISHTHLDHIKDLAFLCDNCFGMKQAPFEVYAHKTAISIIKRHFFNDVIWPDFTVLPNATNPTIRFNEIEEEKKFGFDKYEITAVKVQHPNDAVGFIIEDGESSVLFTVDTGPTDKIWELAHKTKNLKAIFTEVSFPNHLHKVALASDHHTPSSLLGELNKMPGEIPVILTHLKPAFKDEIMQELQALNETRLKVLSFDGEVFQF